MEHWQDIVDRLKACFFEHDSRMSLIADVDHAILMPDESLANIEQLILSGICSHLEIGAAYILTGTQHVLYTVNHYPVEIPEVEIHLPDSFSWPLVNGSDVCDPTQNPEVKIIGAPDNSYLALYPVDNPQISSRAILLASGSSENLRKAVADDFRIRLTAQLRIAQHERHQQARRRLQDKFQAVFHSYKLDLSSCLDFLVKEVATGLSSDRESPLIQILTRDGSHLYIRRSTSEEFHNTRVAIADSVTGYCLEKQLRYYCCDPRKEKHYKAMGATPGKMCTELVVPLRDAGGAYGVINAESPREHAFTQTDIDFLIDVADVVSYPLGALVSRTARAIADRQLMFYAIRSMCDRISTLYQHKLSSPLHNCRNAATLLRDEYAKLSDPQRTELCSNLILGINRLDLAKAELFRDFDRLVDYGAYDLDEIVHDAKRVFAKLKSPTISIHYEEAKGPKVFCSLLLREHIANVIQNAVDSITSRLAKRPSPPGFIKMWVKHTESWDAKDLNQYLVLHINDNGLGLSKEIQPELFVSQRSTKGTCGLALAAARSYLHTIGGAIDYVTDTESENTFCEFSIRLQVYKPQIHDELTSFLSAFR